MFGRNVPTFTVKTVSINIYLRLHTTIFHNSEKLQLLFSAWRHVSAAHVNNVESHIVRALRFLFYFKLA